MDFQMDKIEKKVNGFNMALIVEIVYLKAYPLLSECILPHYSNRGEKYLGRQRKVAEIQVKATK